MTEDEARERVLIAAEELFYRKGFATVGMDEIRNRAGVSLRRLYGVFPSKEALILEFLARQRIRWRQRCDACVEAAGPDPRQRILAIYTFLREWFRSEGFRGCPFLNAFGELGGTDTRVAHVVQDHKSATLDYFREHVEEAGGGPHLATRLWLLSEGAQSVAAIQDDPGLADEARAAAATLIDSELG